MRISNAFWISCFATIGVAINLCILPANASVRSVDSFGAATATDNTTEMLAPYRGSGR